MAIIHPQPLSSIPLDQVPLVGDAWDYTPLPEPIPLIAQHWPPGTRPLVTVQCITYNHQPFIREAINGFLMQKTTFPVRTVVHDDASTDATRAIVEHYATLYPDLFIAILQPVNLYSGKHPRDLSPVMHGKYIATCEGDDYWTDPEKLQIQVRFMEEHAGYSACYHDSRYIDEQGNTLVTSLGRSEGWYGNNLSATDLKKNCFIHLQSLLYRNALPALPPEFYLAYAKDEFLATLLGQLGPCRFIEEIQPSGYRRHAAGVFSGARRGKPCSTKSKAGPCTLFTSGGRHKLRHQPRPGHRLPRWRARGSVDYRLTYQGTNTHRCPS
jgi:hypothetical protein